MAETKEPIKQSDRPSLRSTWREVSRKQKGLAAAMLALLVVSAVFFVFSMTTLRPQNTVVIVGYGDVYGELAGISGGYRRDSWLSMLAFPILAIVFGVVHNIIALRIYRIYGKDAALIWVIATILVVFGGGLVLLRLLGEW